MTESAQPRIARPTADDIAEAKFNLNRYQPIYQHDDCILIAFEFLDAQKPLVRLFGNTKWALAHIIESWGRRFISIDDVAVAANLHPRMTGIYPEFNLRGQLILPSAKRLIGITEAGSHGEIDFTLPTEEEILG